MGINGRYLMKHFSIELKQNLESRNKQLSRLFHKDWILNWKKSWQIFLEDLDIPEVYY